MWHICQKMFVIPKIHNSGYQECHPCCLLLSKQWHWHPYYCLITIISIIHKYKSLWLSYNLVFCKHTNSLWYTSFLMLNKTSIYRNRSLALYRTDWQVHLNACSPVINGENVKLLLVVSLANRDTNLWVVQAEQVFLTLTLRNGADR